ncbi:hypothetical protein BGX27_010188 [Mortierella sp. AM989]|nr:hypothetical protein BGX27_010188 [Mortierella sp. AM989]
MSKSLPVNVRRPPAPPPPVPDVRFKNKTNSDFYNHVPTIEVTKKKHNSLLQIPSPTSDEVITSVLKDSVRDRSSNPSSKPNVAKTKGQSLSSQLHMKPPQPLSEEEEEEEEEDDEDEDFYEIVTDQIVKDSRFKVNPANIPSPKNSHLTEIEQRGRAMLSATPANRSGSPVPSKSKINKIDDISKLLDRTIQEKKELEANNVRLHTTIQELRHKNQDLQLKLENRNRDYDIMSKNYLDHVRMIRATDDDHSTIADKLNQLKASIEHLIRKAQGSRSVNLNKAAAIDHFKDSGLLEGFPIKDNLEPFLLNLYMESVIMSFLESRFFDKPLSCVFDYNSGFNDLYQWMNARNNKLAVRWRQQLCVMLTQDPETKARQEALVTKTADELTALITHIYPNSNEGVKIRELCCKSFELSVAMTALESVISPWHGHLGSRFDEECMATSLKSNPEGDVALVIFPAFKDTNNGFYSRSKVWCY